VVESRDVLNAGISRLWSCMSPPAGAQELGQAASAVGACTANGLLANTLGQAIGLLEHQGRTWFGANFRIDNRLGVSITDGGLLGHLDAVIPLAAFSASETEAGPVYFVQNGLTRWTDAHGVRRNDLRHGIVHRFLGSGWARGGAFGVWAFVQQNLERGHQRLVTGLDYTGRWGTATLNYYQPSTDWRPGRPGYEERALEGMELGLQFAATDTIGLTAAAGRWEAGDDTSGWGTRVRSGVEWSPHAWLRFGGHWEDGGSTGEALGIRAAVTIPLGRSSRGTPRWRGLGLAAGGSKPGIGDLWRPVAGIERIEVAERSVPIVNSTPAATATVRFLQESVDTGATVSVEVLLGPPAAEDTRLAVRLVPGSGDNPAVPGVDYVDETVEVTIGAGETSAIVSFRLLENPGLETERSLSVEVAAVT
jgi:hypothetical protein